MLFPNIKPITQKRLNQLFKNRIGQDYQNWRNAVLARDNHKCQMGSCTSPEGCKLEVHHIKTWAGNKHLRTAIYNGIVLCDKCHDKISGREQAYEAMFFGIVQANMKRLRALEDAAKGLTAPAEPVKKVEESPKKAKKKKGSNESDH